MGGLMGGGYKPPPIVYQAPPEPQPLPEPEPVPVMPDADSEAVRAAQRRLQAQVMRRSGRDSTELSGRGTLG